MMQIPEASACEFDNILIQILFAMNGVSLNSSLGLMLGMSLSETDNFGGSENGGMKDIYVLQAAVLARNCGIYEL